MPLLKEVIREMAAVRPEQMIRIGSEHGSGFVYVGSVREVEYGPINAQIKKRLPRNAPNKYKIETRKKWENAVKNYVPLQDRSIVDMSRSEVEDHIIIIVEGFGGFIQYDPADSGFTDYDEQAMIDLVGALYRETCRTLISAYRKQKESEVRMCEAWIRQNGYGLVSDPEGIIKACRQAKNTKHIKNFYHRTK